jgi:hypothetical protein
MRCTLFWDVVLYILADVDVTVELTACIFRVIYSSHYSPNLKTEAVSSFETPVGFQHQRNIQCIDTSGEKTRKENAARKPRRRLEENIRTYLRVIGWDGIGRVQV